MSSGCSSLMRAFIMGLVFLVSGVCGCTLHRSVINDTGSGAEKPPASLMLKKAMQGSKLMRLYGRVLVKGHGFAVHMRIIWSLSDDMRAEIRDVAGRTQAVLIRREKQWTVLTPARRMAVTGTDGMDVVMTAFKMSLDPDMVFAALKGQLPAGTCFKRAKRKKKCVWRAEFVHNGYKMIADYGSVSHMPVHYEVWKNGRRMMRMAVEAIERVGNVPAGAFKPDTTGYVLDRLP